LTRDFTDDIYNNGVPDNIFVSTNNSTLLADMLVVIQGTKVEEFKAVMATLMAEYYEKNDSLELKRMTDNVKSRIEETKNMTDR